MAPYPLPPYSRPLRRDPGPRQPTLSELALEEMKRGEPEPPFGGWGGEFTVVR